MDADAVKLYLNDPTVHAAVRVVTEAAIRYRQGGTLSDLQDELINLFGSFDRMRREQIESLQLRLTEALMLSAPSVRFTRPSDPER